jgi:hypothetical protein
MVTDQLFAVGSLARWIDAGDPAASLGTRSPAPRVSA